MASIAINDAFREEAASGRYRGVLGVAGDPVVPADVIGDPRTSVVDAAMIREAFAALALPAPDLSRVEP